MIGLFYGHENPTIDIKFHFFALFSVILLEESLSISPEQEVNSIIRNILFKNGLNIGTIFYC